MSCGFGSPVLPDRFWAKVRQADNGCWLWTASKNENGYGKVKGVSRLVLAHRWAYEATVGELPEFLDHMCHNRDLSCAGGASCWHRACVNPSHLEPATKRENALRGRSFVAANAAKTHCPQEHEYTPENTKLDKIGRRSCRRCSVIRAEQRRAQHREATGRSKQREPGRPEHGTVSMYASRIYKCRCDECRSAWRTYQREYWRNVRSLKNISVAQEVSA